MNKTQKARPASSAMGYIPRQMKPAGLSLELFLYYRLCLLATQLSRTTKLSAVKDVKLSGIFVLLVNCIVTFLFVIGHKGKVLSEKAKKIVKRNSALKEENESCTSIFNYPQKPTDQISPK